MLYDEALKATSKLLYVGIILQEDDLVSSDRRLRDLLKLDHDSTTGDDKSLVSFREPELAHSHRPVVWIEAKRDFGRERGQHVVGRRGAPMPSDSLPA